MNTMLNFSKTCKRHRSEKTPSHASLLGNGLNIFQFEIVLPKLALWIIITKNSNHVCMHIGVENIYKCIGIAK